MRTHDGFYFRFAIGAGVLSGTASDDSETELDTTGTAILTEIAFGGSPAPGVVIGGGSYDANIPGTTYTFDGGNLLFGCHLPGHYDYGMRGLVVVGL